MKTLLIQGDPETNAVILSLLQTKFKAKVDEVSSLVAAIEILESPWEAADLIICDYYGSGTALLKCLVELCPKIPCIFVLDDPAKIKDMQTGDAFIPGAVKRQNLMEELTKAIGALQQRGLLTDVKKKTADSDFVRLPISTLTVTGPIGADIFIRLAANHYTKLFKKEAQYDFHSLEPQFKQKGVVYFYVPLDQYADILAKQNAGLDKMVNDPEVKPEEARETVQSTLDVMADLCEKVGFTPQVQALALKSVQLTLKVLGSKPSLAEVLANLKKNEGKYLSSHSLILGEIACACACKIGWKSASTLLKLALASFLHDLPLKDDKQAKARNLEEALKTCGMNSQDILAYKLHPAKAAEYARKFHEIPPDVDNIIAQHHERPDGKGFPRGLFHNRLSPLSCLFIIAEDMTHFFHTHKDATIAKFIEANGENYELGVFKKIIRSLATDVEMDEL